MQFGMLYNFVASRQVVRANSRIFSRRGPEKKTNHQSIFRLNTIHYFLMSVQ
jgi:hypothetical protein